MIPLNIADLCLSGVKICVDTEEIYPKFRIYSSSKIP